MSLTAWTTVVCSVDLCELCSGDIECGHHCHDILTPVTTIAHTCTPPDYAEQCTACEIDTDDAYRRRLDV
jgi:hypothetical protein